MDRGLADVGNVNEPRLDQDGIKCYVMTTNVNFYLSSKAFSFGCVLLVFASDQLRKSFTLGLSDVFDLLKKVIKFFRNKRAVKFAVAEVSTFNCSVSVGPNGLTLGNC